MRLQVSNVNFLEDKDWLFELTNGQEKYYIMNESFYKKEGLKNPLTKHDLDMLDVGESILCVARTILDKNVVVSIRR